MYALRFEVLGAADGVVKPLVAAVDDDVALLHELAELCDGIINGLPCHDKYNHLSGHAQRFYKFAHILVPVQRQISLGLGAVHRQINFGR